jgi:hypothetical protein
LSAYLKYIILLFYNGWPDLFTKDGGGFIREKHKAELNAKLELELGTTDEAQDDHTINADGDTRSPSEPLGQMGEENTQETERGQLGLGEKSDPQTNRADKGRDELSDSGKRGSERSDNTQFDLNSVPEAGTGTPKVRVENNVNASSLMKQIKAEGSYATQAEKQILARYSGWGPLGFVFDPTSSSVHGKEAHATLSQILTKSEYNSIRASIDTAFYTSKEVVNAMWAGVEAMNLGKHKINVLEPTVGSGNFIGWQPQALRERSNWSATEIDTVTGNLAALIYDEANIQVKPFQYAFDAYQRCLALQKIDN